PFYNSVYFFDKTTGNLTNGDSPAEMHRLNTLSRLFILTSDNTASASEMIINGLKPYLNEVVLIGDTTYGKNVGSFTIYDSPNFGPNNINPNHNVAIQPITLLIFNKNDESDYVAGF